MKEHEQRAMKDQHARDEAALRQSQEEAAGGGRPVEAYPPHGTPTSAGSEVVDDRSVIQHYQDSFAQEQQAWAQVKALPGRKGFDSQSWEEWRSAVEERDKATRLLINHALTTRGD